MTKHTYVRLYENGRWSVSAAPCDKGCVDVFVDREGGGWVHGAHCMISPSRRGWPHSRFWQRSVESAVRWGIRLADKMARKDEHTTYALEQATRAIEPMRAQAESLRILEAELSL